MKFAVKITESLSKIIIVDTDVYRDVEDFHDAVSKVESAYKNSGIILESDDFDDVEIGESLTFGENPIADDDERVTYFTTL